MRGLVLTLLLVAVLVPSSAQAHGGVDCYQNGREIAPDQCAWHNMVAYAQGTYYLPSLQAVWEKPSRYGRWHSKWGFYPSYPATKLRFFTLSARRCGGGHMVVLDRRRKVYWPHGC